MKKRIVSLSLAACLLVGSLSACNFQSQQNANKSTGNKGTELTLEYEDKENAYGWAKPKKTLEISVYGGEGDQAKFEKDEAGGKKYYDKWLLDNMNVKIDWHMYSNAMDEKLNMMLASGDYPDVITNMTDEMANKFIAQGKAVDLTDLIAKYAPNYTRRTGQYFSMLKDKNGKVFKLDSYYGENPNVAGWDFGMRYDYWKELGKSEIYKTPDEYFDALQQVLKNHPKNAKGQQTYAFSSDSKGNNFLRAMLSAYGFIGDYKVEGDKFTHWLNTEEGLKVAKFMNKCYRAGMVDPDYLNNTYDQLIAKINNEQILGNLGSWWYVWTGGHEYWATQQGGKYDVNKRFMNVSIAGDGVDPDKTTSLTSSFISGYRCIITNKCKNPADVMKFINWENSELGNIIQGWGPPSEDNFWNIDKDGTWKIRDDCMDPTKKANNQKISEAHGAGIYKLALNGNWLKTTDSPTQGKANFDKIDKRVGRVSVFDFWGMNADGTFTDKGVNISWGNYKAKPVDTTLYKVTYDPTDDITTVHQNIDDAVEKGWASMLSAKSEEACEAAFNETKKQCESLGLDKLTKFNKDSHDANVKVYEGK